MTKSFRQSRNETLGIICVGWIVWVLACGGGSPSRSRDSIGDTPGIEVTASDLVAAYKANEIAADQRYKNQVVRVRGTVDGIGKDILASPYVTLSGAPEDSFRSVQAFFPKDSESALANIQKGQTLTVRCRVDGLMMNVLLKECRF